MTTQLRSTSSDQAYLDRRYDRVLVLANKWMDLTGSTKSGLAKRIGVHHSTLVRFLNRQVGYEPTPTRPRMLRILDQILRTCSIDDVVYPAQAIRPELALDDDYRAYVEHRWHVRQVREKFTADPEEGLLRIGALHSSAIHASPRFRSRLALNVLGALACLVDKKSSRKVAREILVRTTERAQELESAALASCDQLFERDERLQQCAQAFTGYILAYCGFYLDHRDLLESAIERLSNSARVENRLEDGIWANYLGFIDFAFKEADPDAMRWSEMAARVAKTAGGESLCITLETKSLPRVKKHWRKASPELLPKSNTGARKPSSKLGKVVGVVLAIATVFLGSAVRSNEGSVDTIPILPFEIIEPRADGAVLKAADIREFTPIDDADIREFFRLISIGDDVDANRFPLQISAKQAKRMPAQFSADVDRDGLKDIVLLDRKSQQVSIFFGRNLVTFRRGDVDSNGAVNLLDVTKILHHLFSPREDRAVECEDAADVDDNDHIEVHDAITLLRFVVLGDTPPSAPFPERGRDPSDDDLGCRRGGE